MIIGRGPRLEPKLCFELWVELGTLEKATRWMTERGAVHKQPTPAGVRHAAHRWALLNPDDAFRKMQDRDPGLTREQFEHWAVYTAAHAYKSERRLIRFLRNLGVYESQKYRDIYEHKFPTVHDCRDSDL